MAWDSRCWAAWRESRFSGSRRGLLGVTSPIGDRPSISTNERPCNQHHLHWLGLTRSESRAGSDASKSSRLTDASVYPPWANQRLVTRTFWSPRATLPALVLQPSEPTSSTGTLREVSACSWPSAHSAVQIPATPATPCSPLPSAVCCCRLMHCTVECSR